MFSFGELLWRDVSVPVSDPVLEVGLVGLVVVRVAAGGFHCGALSEEGSIHMWGENTAGQCGLSDSGTASSITGELRGDVLRSACVSVSPAAVIHYVNPFLSRVGFSLCYLVKR